MSASRIRDCRAIGLALAILCTLTANWSSPAGAASYQFTGPTKGKKTVYFERYADLQCPSGSCADYSQPVKKNKLLIVRNLSCKIVTVSENGLGTVGLIKENLDAKYSVTKSFTPEYIGRGFDWRYYTFNQPTGMMVRHGETLKIIVSALGTYHTNMQCHLFGELITLK